MRVAVVLQVNAAVNEGCETTKGQDLFASMDEDGSGQISFKELLLALVTWSGAADEDE